ncbi:MAG: hypothetical protein PHW83_10170 [Bacteroidales bacterium]|nr:hypothetical protein [Bacteroidales bacterium]
MKVLVMGNLNDFPEKMNKFNSNENLTDKVPYRNLTKVEVEKFLEIYNKDNLSFDDLYNKYCENYNDNAWVKIDGVWKDTYLSNPDKKFAGYKIISTNKHKNECPLLVDAIITNTGDWIQLDYLSEISITDWINKVENLVNAKDAQFVLCDCIGCGL